MEGSETWADQKAQNFAMNIDVELRWSNSNDHVLALPRTCSQGSTADQCHLCAFTSLTAEFAGAKSDADHRATALFTLLTTLIDFV
jgi:hypothetical protein